MNILETKNYKINSLNTPPIKRYKINDVDIFIKNSPIINPSKIPAFNKSLDTNDNFFNKAKKLIFNAISQTTHGIMAGCHNIITNYPVFDFHELTDEKRTANQMIEKMLVKAPDIFQRQVILKAFINLGVKNVQKICDAGIKFEIYEGNLLSMDESNSQAFYFPVNKLIRISPNRLKLDTTLHEMGHALDDALILDEDKHFPRFKSCEDNVLNNHYEDYMKQYEKMNWFERLYDKRLWSEYATQNIEEYLAEGICFYSTGENSRKKLQNADPKLCEYVAKLLEKS